MPLAELELIKHLRERSNHLVTRRSQNRALAVGIGDDCAVLRFKSGQEILVTTDFSLENVHFRREWHPADVVGHRCLARGLSDIAAMGGWPVAVFLSLAVPRQLRQRWADDFLRGFLRLASRFGVVLAGGDTAQSPDGVLADIVVVGTVPSKTAVLRSGARPGDLIYATGKLGQSASVLERLRAAPRTRLRPKDYPAHFYPTPRLEAGKYLREHGMAVAMIDISDGLSTDLGHICQESGVGARVEAERIPRAANVKLETALHGGEDYELLFTASAGKRVPGTIKGLQVSRIGEIVRGRDIRILREGKWRTLPEKGWEHFRG